MRPPVQHAAATAFGGLDAVVYAVGRSPLGPMAGASEAEWHDVLATNVVGAAISAAAAAPHLLATGGRFVALSSKIVRQPLADLALYATSKAALEGLLRCLPVEYPGLRVTQVVVGNTHGTDFSAGWDPDAFDAALHRWAAAGGLGSTSTMDPVTVADTVIGVLASPAHVEQVVVLEPPEPPTGS